jgi:hypothetical protein
VRNVEVTAIDSRRYDAGMQEVEALIVELPAGWVERANPEGPREFSPSQDGTEGVLQVSRLGDLPGDVDLGLFAAQLGQGFTEIGQNWGQAIGTKAGPCALGQFGFAMFRGGEFPGMILWILQTPDAAFLWSWLGPSLAGETVEQAVRIVLTSRLRPSE